MRHFPAVVALSLAFAFAGTANAGVVFGNLGGSGTGGLFTANESVTGTTWAAQGFTGPFTAGVDDQLVSVTLGLANEGAPAVATASLYSGASAPTGTAIVSDTATVSGSTPTLYTFDLSQQLSNGTNYWLVVSGNAALQWNLSSSFSAPTQQNASGWSHVGSAVSTDTGGSWTGGSGATDVTSISVEAVPEPSMLALSGLGIFAAAFFASRKRLAA